MRSNAKGARGASEEKFNLTHSWVVWACAALFYCYQFMLRVSPGVMADELMASFQVEACSLGILVGCYNYMYSSLQIPAGTLMDYFKPRRMLTIAAFIAGGGALVFSYADSLSMACFGRALIGVGSAMGFLSCLKLGTLWFPSHKLPFVIGMTLFLGTTGAVVAGYPLAWLVHALDWRLAMRLLAFVGLGVAILAWLIVRDTPPPSLEKAIIKSHGDRGAHVPQATILETIREVIRKPQSWLIALYGFSMYVPLAGFTDLWGTPFLTAVYHLDKTTAATVNSLLYVGLGLGAPLVPFLCQLFNAYRPVIFISAFVPLILLSAVFYFPVFPLWALMGLLFVSGAFLSGQFLAFAMTCALNPLSASGTAGGFHNMICMLSGVVAQPLIGWVLDRTWQGGCQAAIHTFTHVEYAFALSSIIAALVMACGTVLFIKEQY